jgi:hypothetical protein
MLKNLFSPRLLKKVQMQGGAPILWMGTRGGVPTAGGSRRTLGTLQQVPEQAGDPAAGWVPADGPFSAACYAMARPPSTCKVWPVMLSESGEARNTAAPTRSSGDITRPRGMRATRSL